MKFKQLSISLFIFLIFLMITSCQPIKPGDINDVPTSGGTSYPILIPTDGFEAGYPSPIQGEILVTPTNSAEKISGACSIQASIFSISLDKRFNNTLVYLTKAVGENKDQLYPVLSDPRPSIGDIVGITDEDGSFVLQNIAPGNYFIIVQFPPYWTAVQISKEDPKPQLLILEPDTNLNLGMIYIP